MAQLMSNTEPLESFNINMGRIRNTKMIPIFNEHPRNTHIRCWFCLDDNSVIFCDRYRVYG